MLKSNWRSSAPGHSLPAFTDRQVTARVLTVRWCFNLSKWHGQGHPACGRAGTQFPGWHPPSTITHSLCTGTCGNVHGDHGLYFSCDIPTQCKLQKQQRATGLILDIFTHRKYFNQNRVKQQSKIIPKMQDKTCLSFPLPWFLIPKH